MQKHVAFLQNYLNFNIFLKFCSFNMTAIFHNVSIISYTNINAEVEIYDIYSIVISRDGYGWINIVLYFPRKVL